MRDVFLKWRVRLGVSLLVLGACASVVRQLSVVAESHGPEDRAPAVVAEYDGERLAGLAGDLPAGGVAGYLTSTRHNDNPDRSHALAQYVLAPCLIVLGETSPLVVVDLGPDEPTPDVLFGRPVLRQLPSGVRLVGSRQP